jgi:hypothetical protein
MSVEVMSGPIPTTPAASRPLALLREPHPALAAQQAFVADAARVLRRAGASGERLTTALFLILTEHSAVPVAGDADGLHLRCSRCDVEDARPAGQYPCPTAAQAFWALDAALG